MSDLFISYSRKDTEFVRRLHVAFEQAGKDAWADWEDIAPSADWMAEIYRAIEDADGFVFVLSPDSVGSEVCGRELAHAAGNNKRIIPILAREVDPKLVPEPAGRHQWISFADGDDFDAAFAELQQALETDLEWVAAHTRWLGRAREWEQGGRDRGLLLRGTDLSSAESWLSERSEGQGPEPTALQTEYIVTSRQAASRRQRLGFALVAVALVVATALAAVALVQRNQANTQKRVAQEQTRRAEAEVLAARAEQVSRSDPALGVRLAAEAVRTSDTARPEATLISLVSGLRDDLLLQGHSAGVSAVAYSPDGEQLATASYDGTARIWDTSTGAQLRVLDAHTERVQDVAYSADGSRIATASLDGTARLWDAATGAQVALLRSRGPKISVAISPDGRLVATGNYGGRAEIWDVARREPVHVLRGHHHPVTAIEFSPDGKLVAAANGDGTVEIWNVATGKPRLSPQGHSNGLTGVAFSPDGRLFATSGLDRTVEIRRVATGTKLKTIRVSNAVVNDVAFSPNGERIATTSADNIARLWDLSTGRMLERFPGTSDQPIDVAFSPDGKEIATAGLDGAARIWDITDKLDPIDLDAADATLQDLAVRPDGATIVAGALDGRTFVWNANTGARLAATQSPYGGISGLASDPSGSRLAVAGSGAWASPLSKGDQPLKLSGAQFYRIAFSPDGTRIAAAGVDGTVPIWNAETGDLETTLKGQTDSVADVAFSPDGAEIATASLDRTVWVWDAVSGKVLKTLTGHSNPVDAVAFSPDGSRIATASFDGTARVWDAATGRNIAEMRGHDNKVTDVAFTADGARILTTSLDHTARFWDASSGEQMREVDAGSPLAAGSMVPASNDAVVVGANGTARIYPCGPPCMSPSDVLALADREAGTITDDELDRYLAE
jgi:WD40 repeat protein